MGVYVFNVAALTERMQTLSKEYPDLDFGKHVIPSMAESHRIFTYPFDGYWVDVGTVDAYWGTSTGAGLGSVKAESLRSELGYPHQERGTARRSRGRRPAHTRA